VPLEGLTAADWIRAGIIVVVTFAVAAVVRRVAARFVSEEHENVAARFVGRLLGTLVTVVGLAYALAALDVRLAPLLGAIGLGGLAVAFAAQSILANLFASLILMARRPFRRGDQITTGGHEGTVEDVNFRVVVLRSYDGEKVLVPCSEVLDNAIVNHTARGRRRTTLDVGVAYDTDLEQAREVIIAAVRTVDGLHPGAPVEAWVESLGESSIDFAVRFWHAPDIATMWRVRSEVAMAVKRALDDAGIAIPFPQLDVRFPDTA
jgi:small conductance mechanosensitive channel